MSKGVYTFQGGTDRLIGLMARMLQSGVDLRIRARSRRSTSPRTRRGLTVNGRHDQDPRGRLQRQPVAHHFPPGRRPSSSIRLRRAGPGRAAQQFQRQVYLAPEARQRAGREPAATCCSARTAPCSGPKLLLSRNVTSRTLFVLLSADPAGSNRTLIVSSTNANYSDWADLPPDEYEASKRDLIETTSKPWPSTCPTSATSWTTSKPPRR